ncbi:MAG: hypothetical protein R2875_09980 [Desulfobacterales bacterium]
MALAIIGALGRGHITVRPDLYPAKDIFRTFVAFLCKTFMRYLQTNPTTTEITIEIAAAMERMVRSDLPKGVLNKKDMAQTKTASPIKNGDKFNAASYAWERSNTSPNNPVETSS